MLSNLPVSSQDEPRLVGYGFDYNNWRRGLFGDYGSSRISKNGLADEPFALLSEPFRNHDPDLLVRTELDEGASNIVVNLNHAPLV
jgi:hypothetical protein